MAKEFTIENVEKGTYILVITKDNHVTREYDVTIEDADVSVETKIHLLGDINGDGKITIIDYARANAHAKGVQQLTGYELQCADTVKQDGIITTADAARINAHAKGKSYMW